MLQIIPNSELTGENREKVFRRSQADIDAIAGDVKSIIDDVRARKDEAIVDYVRQFDDPDFAPDRIRVSQEEVEAAYEKVDPKVLEMIRKQISISRAFHEEQARRIYSEKEWEIETVPGVRTGARKGPIDSAGLYVPAGKAPLPTVAQILTVAAKAAGVPRIAIFFPPTSENNEIIVAANEAGADEIYRVGGVAAIAAMAYGTPSIPRVDKIAGPGSPWVQAAKLQVFGQVGIDMLSGPSEALIMADSSANPAWVASDILARVEHGSDSACPVVTTDENLARAICKELEKQLPNRSRQQYLQPGLANGYNLILIVKSIDEMVEVANEYGAEHLQVYVKDAEEVSKRIRNAGSIFIRPYAPVPVGDYASGTNHCLPTSRAVKFSSPVGVETFVKTNEFQVLTEEGLRNLQPIVDTIADTEGLDGHREAVDIRLRKKS